MASNFTSLNADQMNNGLFSIVENEPGHHTMTQKEVNEQYERLRKQGVIMNTLDDGEMMLRGSQGYLQHIKGNKQRTHSKEILYKKQLGTIGNHFPQIVNPVGNQTSKARVGSSGFVKDFGSNFQAQSVMSDDDELMGSSPRNASQDPFTRINKFKNAAIKGVPVHPKSQGLKKQRYSVQQDVQTKNGFSSVMASGNSKVTKNGSSTTNNENLDNPRIMQEKKLTATLEEINVLDLVNKGKLSQQQQLKPISTKNLTKHAQSFGPSSFEVQKTIGLFRSGNQENISTVLSQGPSTQRAAPLHHKSVLPNGVVQRDTSVTETPRIENLISVNSKGNPQKQRKVSITCINTSNNQPKVRETHSQSMVITESDAALQSTRNPLVISLQNSREGRIIITDHQIDTSRQSLSHTLQRKIGLQGKGGAHQMMLKMWTQLFEARNEDLNIVRTNQKQLERFIKGVEKSSQRRKLILNEMGFGHKSAHILQQLIRVGGNIEEWTLIDLSMNKLGLNLEPVIKGLKMNNKLVSLRLSNNELGGNQQHVQLIKSLIMEHPSLTDIDLSNDESNQNKNKIGNAGLEAIMEGILDSNNDLGADFFSTLGYDALYGLKELQVANCKLNKKSLSDLSEMLGRFKFQMLNLDLSNNHFNAEGLFRLFSALKNNQMLRRLNLSRNDFLLNLDVENPPPLSSYYSTMEQFLSLNRSLEELIMNDCKLGPEGAAIIGKGLRRNQKLSKLMLSQNRLEDRGLNAIIEGVLDNVVTTSQMQGILVVAPIVELDLSKNEIELKDANARAVLCKLISEQKSRLSALSLRDNLIRDEPADAICLSLKQNLSLMKFQIDMNPIKMATLKEMELQIKRNIARFKEKQAPAIKKEINVLYQERQRVMEDLPESYENEYQGKSLYETAAHLDHKATLYEKASTMFKQQFMEDDRKLDEIRDEALRQERQLVQERERLREIRRDTDFAEEQMDLRIARQERQWEKQLVEQQEKLEIVKLAQSKTIDERNKLAKELEKKKENHRLQVDAWNRELAIIMREQAVSAMIQESYQKEIDRVKKQQIMMREAEDCRTDNCDTNAHSHQPPATAGSVGHRFGPANKKQIATQQRRGNSNLRRMDSNHSSQLKENNRRGSTQVRQPQPLKSNSGLQLINKENSATAPPSQGSPSQKIHELQQMKKELKREFRKHEAEVEALTKKDTNRQTKENEVNQTLQRKRTLNSQSDKIPHVFRIPNQQNYP